MEEHVSSYEFAVPQSITEARKRVLKIPGMDQYIPDDNVSSSEIDEGIERAVSDLNRHLDAEGSKDFITFSLALTQEESEEFFSHSERQPFQSKIKVSEDLGEQTHQFLVIGTYLRLKYEDIRQREGVDDSKTQKKAESLRLFFSYSSDILFSKPINSLRDKINGVEARDVGARPTPQILSLMRKATDRVAKEHKLDPEELYANVMTVTEGGNYEAAFSFLLNHQGDETVRKALQEIIEERTHDPDLTAEKLQLLWKIEKYRLLMGIDLETLYILNQIPGGAEIESKLHEFLSNKAHVTEMRGHLDREAKSSLVQGVDKNAPIDFWQMLEGRAFYHNFPSNVETSEELNDKKGKVWRQLAQYLPSIAFEETPTSFMDAPTRFGARLRAFNITYPNKEGRLVNIVILNPRNEESLFAQTFGHELGHKLHARVLRVAEDAGYVPEQSWEKLPRTVAEEFSQLVEDQVGKIKRREKDSENTQDKEESESEWRDLWHAYIIRRQAPYALAQRTARLMMEEMWKGGKRDELTKKEVDVLIDELDSQLKNSYSEGVKITSPNQNILNNINLENPLDGLVYLLKYVEESKEEKADINKDFIGMKQAFSERFGEIWIDNLGARAILLALMAETGNNQDISTYADFVLSVDIQETFSKLESWGIKRQLI